MSNFADMAYDNYLMHYRTKGSKNGFTKDPDYTPVGEKARKMQIDKYSNQARRGDYAGMPTSVGEAQEKARSDKINKLIRENKQRRYDIKQLSKQKFRGDYAGMPSSVVEITKQDIQKRRDESGKRWDDRMRLISKLSKQASKGDYAGMPSSALATKEKGDIASEINRLSNQASRGDYAGMPSSVKEAKEKAKEERNKRILAKYEIYQLSKQASRGDMGGMPSSARDAKESTKKASEINRLSKQASRGDYAGMPSSALEAKENAKIQKRDRMKANAEAKRKAEYMKAKAEAKRKKESEINRLSEQASRGDLGGMPSSARSGNAYVKNRLAFKEWARKEREKDAREKARRNLQIDKLSRQKSKGDYAGMPSSAREAKEKVIRDKAWGIGFEAQRKYEKIREEKEEAKRKKNPKAYVGGKRLMMPK